MKFSSTRGAFAISVFTVAMWAVVFADNVLAVEARLEFKLGSPNPQGNAGFGTVLVTLDGQIVVGEPWRSGSTSGTAGYVHVFDGETGALNLTINNPQQANGVTFGEYLTAGDGQIFVTGRWGQQESVYAYDLTSGAVNYVIDSPESTLVDFGYGITYGGGNLFVAAPWHDIAPFQAVGKVYRYDAETGSLEGDIDSPIQAPGIFGSWRSLAAVHDRVVIASRVLNQAWIFDRDTSDVLFQLQGPNPPGGGFGFSVAANSGLVAIGTAGDSTSGPANSGAVYLFDGSTGDLLLEIANPEPAYNGMFGWAVAAFDDRLVIGRRDAGDDWPASSWGPGAAYVFRVVPEPGGFLILLVTLLSSTQIRMPQLKI